MNDDAIEATGIAARERLDAAARTLAAELLEGILDAETELVARMMFGVPGPELAEDQVMSAIGWIAKERPAERLHRGAVRGVASALSRLVILYDGMDERLNACFEPGNYLDLTVEALAAGTVTGMASACDALEASWHDERLTREEGIEAVEAVEALRSALRRMEACGLRTLSDFDASNPSSRPAMP